MDNQAIPNIVYIGNGERDDPAVGVRTNEVACPVQSGLRNASSGHLNDNHRAAQVKRDKGTRSSMADIRGKAGDPGVAIAPLVGDIRPPGQHNPAPENEPHQDNGDAKKKIRQQGRLTFLLYKNMLLCSCISEAI